MKWQDEAERGWIVCPIKRRPDSLVWGDPGPPVDRPPNLDADMNKSRHKTMKRLSSSAWVLTIISGTVYGKGRSHVFARL